MAECTSAQSPLSLALSKRSCTCVPGGSLTRPYTTAEPPGVTARAVMPGFNACALAIAGCGSTARFRRHEDRAQAFPGGTCAAPAKSLRSLCLLRVLCVNGCKRLNPHIGPLRIDPNPRRYDTLRFQGESGRDRRTASKHPWVCGEEGKCRGYLSRRALIGAKAPKCSRADRS